MIQGKAWLAPVLIERAWQQTLQQGGAVTKPWPWADTWPVARLRVPALEVDLLVLAGDRGNALAFGPGHAGASAVPGTRGQSVIAGHRDTHFAFLRELRLAITCSCSCQMVRCVAYSIQASRVIDSNIHQLTVQEFGRVAATGYLLSIPRSQCRRLPALPRIRHARTLVARKDTGVDSKRTAFSL